MYEITETLRRVLSTLSDDAVVVIHLTAPGMSNTKVFWLGDRLKAVLDLGVLADADGIVRPIAQVTGHAKEVRLLFDFPID